MSPAVPARGMDQTLNLCPTLEPAPLLERYQEIRAHSERLCEPLETEDFVVQSMEDASPTKWHLAHTTWFFETFVLSHRDPGYQSRHPEYAFLFNSYYVQAGERYPRPRRGLVTRPSVQDVFDYRQYVDEGVCELLRKTPQNLDLSVIEVGIHHEQQHQELMLTDLKHLFSFNPLHPCYQSRNGTRDGQPSQLGWIYFGEGIREIGHDGQGFCFDNEMPRHRQFLENFEIADQLVTNQQFIEFMADGGYQQPTLWLSEGWATVEEEHWCAPLYWQEIDGAWQYFTLNGFRLVNPHEPVCHLSYFEADAFARWAGGRLPTEAEWEVASSDVSCQGNFAGQENYHPVPLGQALVDSPSQMFGDVWEWTGSPYVGYPGYRPLEGVLGEYNGKFMSN